MSDDKPGTPQSHDSGFEFVTHLPKDLGFPAHARPKPFSRLTRRGKRPVCLGFRSSEGFITFVVGFGIFVDLFVYGCAAPVVPFRLRELGHEDNVSAMTGWLVAAYAGGLILSSPVVGYLGERTRGRQLPLVIGLLFLIASLVMFMLSKTFALLLVSRILQGISGTVLFSLGLALLAECVPAERVAAASGNAMVGLSLGSVLGPVAGGALYDQLGYAAPWILCIALVVVDLVLRLFIIEADRAAPWRSPDLSASAVSDVESEQKAEEAQVETLVQPPGKKTPGPALAFAKLACHPRALASMLVSIAAGVLFGNLDAALTLRLHERYGLSATGAGLVFIAFAIPTVIFSPLSGYLSDRYGQKPAVLIGVLGVCPFFALLTIERMNLVAFVAVLTFVGVTASFTFPPCTADLAELVRELPGAGNAHAYSLFNMSFAIGSFVGPIIASQLLEHLGIREGWYATAGVTVAFYLLAIPMILIYYPAWKLAKGQKLMVELQPVASVAP